MRRAAGDQQFVSDGVAEGIVDLLETVQVEIAGQLRCWCRMASRLVFIRSRNWRWCKPVKRASGGEVVDALLDALRSGDIGDGQDDARSMPWASKCRASVTMTVMGWPSARASGSCS